MIRPFLRGALLGFPAGVALVLGALYLHRHPLTFPAEEREVPGSAVHAGAVAAAADAVVVVHGGEVRRAAASGRFADLDLSWSWVNLLSQEIGPYRVVDLAGGAAALPDAGLLIWTRSASAVADAAQMAALRTAVEAGAVAVIELPTAPLAELAGLAGAGGISAASGLSLPDGPPLGPAARRALEGLDLPANLLAAEPEAGVEILLRIGGRPAALRRRTGEGWVITLMFDLGRLLVSLQQGTPRDDLAVENRYVHRLAPLVETSDLVASASLLDNPVPLADLLEGLLVAWVESVRPLPGWWGYPDGAAGAFLMTHDDEGIGGKARWMTEHEARIGAPSTSFFLPSEDRLTREALDAMRRDGTEVGIHWARDGDGYWEQRFLGPVRVSRRGRSLEEQIGWLRGLLPQDAPVTAARSHYLVWSADWAGSFRAMAAAGIQVDSSYGVDRSCRGYLFGTGRPFRPLDHNGLPLPLVEIPHLGAEDLHGFDAGFLEQLLAESRDSYHQAITVLFHPNTPQWRPSVDLYRHWRHSYDAARTGDHALLTLGEMAAFDVARRAASLRSTWDGTMLRLEGEARDPGLRLRLPAAVGGLVLAAVESAGRPLPTLAVQALGRSLALVSPGPGPFQLEAAYRSAPEYAP